MEDIATTLSVLRSEGYISRFSYKGESYKVIPEANPQQRIDRAWLERYYVRSASVIGRRRKPCGTGLK